MFKFTMDMNNFKVTKHATWKSIQNLTNKVNNNIIYPTKLTKLSLFFSQSLNEYHKILKTKDLNKISIFLGKVFGSIQFINDVSEIIGFYQNIPVSKSINKTSRLHRNFQSDLKNIEGRTWSYNNFTINLDDFYWKNLIPINIDWIDDEHIPEFFKGILLDNARHMSRTTKMIEFGRVITNDYIYKHLTLRYIINECYGRNYFQQFSQCFKLSKGQLNADLLTIQNSGDIKLSLDNNMLRHIAKNDPDLFAILHF